MVKKWMGGLPGNCDICRRPIKGKFVDGATKSGPWATMCTTCHAAIGRGLGTGQGQLYSVDTLEKLEG